MRMSRRLQTTAAVGLLVLGGVLVACGDDDAAAPDTSAPTETTTPDDPGTTAAPTTAATPTTAAAPTTAATPTTTAAPTTAAPPPLADDPPFRSDGPSGSGCTPGMGPLPDGWWFGLLAPAMGGDTLPFDLACFYVGAAAETEAALRGDEVNNDYYIVNDEPILRAVPLAPGAEFRCVDAALPEATACARADLGGIFPLWVRVQGGLADLVVEQYLP